MHGDGFDVRHNRKQVMRNLSQEPVSLFTQIAHLERLLEQSLLAMNNGIRLDAMEAIYTASCLIEEIRSTQEALSGASSPCVTDSWQSTSTDVRMDQ